MGCLGLRFTSKVAEKKPVGAVGLLMPCCLTLPLIGPLFDEKKLPGLRVDKVDKAVSKKWADTCGVKPDWRLMSVNEHRVDTIADLNKVIASAHAAQKLAYDAAPGAVKASEDILIQTWRRKLTLRFVVYKKHGVKGMVPMTVQVADERWHEALMYIAPKFPIWMRKFLSYAPEVPDGMRRHFTFDPKDERNQEELTAFYENIFGDKGDDADDGGGGDDEDAAALRLSADRKAEQEKQDAMKSWRVRSITKTDAAGRKAVSKPTEKPTEGHEPLWEADAEKDLAKFDKLASEAISKTNESALQAKLRHMSATAKQAMGEGEATEEVTIEFEQALRCISLNPNKEHRLRFNIRAEEQNRRLELRVKGEKAALQRKRSGGGGGGGVSDVVDDDDTDSDDDDKPAATVTTPHGTVIEMDKELKIVDGKELLKRCGLNLTDTRGKLGATKGTSAPKSPLSRERSRRASQMGADEVCTSVESITPDTQASRRDGRRGWVITEASLVGTGLARMLDGNAGGGGFLEQPHGDDEHAPLVEKDEKGAAAVLKRGAPANAALVGPDDLLRDDEVEFKDLDELSAKLYHALQHDVCKEVEFGFVLPRGMTFVEDQSSDGWKVEDVGQGSEADLKGIKHHWVLVSVEGVSLDVNDAQSELEALMVKKNDGSAAAPAPSGGAATSRNALWQRLAHWAKESGNDLDLVFRMPKYVPKIRSLTGGVFGESDPLNLENSILSAKQRDRSLTYDEWKDTSFRLLKVGWNSRNMSQEAVA